ncbi:MAG: DUF4174 domain-containing protein [Alphaproteobacteria bacterium]
MRTLQAILFVCALFLVVPSYAQEKIDAPFDRLQDKAWALVLTGPDIDPLYMEQLAMLQAVADTLIAREMVVIHFHGRTLEAYPELSVAQYKLPSMNGSKKGTSTHEKIERMEEQLLTDDDVFSVVLVDKDGVTKYVWTAMVVGPRDIFNMMDNPQPMVKPEAAAPEKKSSR